MTRRSGAHSFVDPLFSTMTDSDSSTMCRPKRLTMKQSDDNVLGISWKEERELRKAMYVSLRQQQKREADEPRALRPRMPNYNSNKNSLLPWRHQRLTSDRWASEYKLRNAKLNASLRSAATAVVKKTTRRNRLSLSNSTTATDRLEKTVQSREEKSATYAAQNKRNSMVRNNNKRQTTASSTTVNRGNSSNPPKRRPTLMSASNDSKTTRKRTKVDNSRPNAQYARLRSPVKFAAAFLRSRKSSEQTPVVSECTTQSPNSSPFKLPIHPARKYRSAASCTGTPNDASNGSVQKCLFPQDPVIRSSVRSSKELVPPELCEDPKGRPVSVHDFVEFVCYRGTPFLDSHLKWFDMPQSSRTRHQQHTNRFPDKLGSSATESEVKASPSPVNSPSKGLPIAKKLPSMDNAA